MNIKEYISSGILEEYAAGAVGPQEKQEVECMAHIYPEIQEELDNVLCGLEAMAEVQSVEPPEVLKQDIMSAIDNVDQDTPEEIKEEGDKKTVQMYDQEPEQSSAKNYASVISIAALLAVIFAGGIYFYGELDGKKATIAELEGQNQELAADKKAVSNKLDQVKTNNQKVQDKLAIVQNKATEKVRLQGTDNQKDGLATIYWNKNSNKVFLNVNKLKNPPTKKQYQLWALVDGKPVDMGVFDLPENPEQLKRMTVEVKNAGGFAVTLEPKGGSKKPTMDQMMVIGKV